jgi:Na+-translocating ferredoxin:NAD+ oxidoreductase RnfC subunit
MNGTLIAKVREAGIVGAGGAGFPTAVKLDSEPEFVLVNGVECEPLIRVDQQLAARYAPVLLKTLDILVGETNAKKGIFVLKEQYADACKALEKAVKNYPSLSIKTLPSVYPMGDEHILVYEALGRIVPEGGIPLNVGAVVVNTETLLNIHRALDEGAAVTEKYVTVTGAVKTPATFKVPLGVSYRSLIEAAGGSLVMNPVLIDGGPMMGKVQRDLDAPVIKTSKAIIVLPENHPVIVSQKRPIEQMLRLGRAACCHCAMCSDLCPRSLMGHSLSPDKLMRLASYNSTCETEAAATTAYLCSECRLCEYSCIMGLQPWKLNSELKRRLKNAGIKNPHHDKPEKTRDFRNYRKYPTAKLARQLGLAEYYHTAAPLIDYPGQIDAVKLPFQQHFGAPAKATAAPGDKVKKGDKIAVMEEGALGADIHASIDGTVDSVDERFIIIKREKS